jgi:hypothetical protein
VRQLPQNSQIIIKTSSTKPKINRLSLLVGSSLQKNAVRVTAGGFLLVFNQFVCNKENV